MGVTKVKVKQLEGAAGGGATVLNELGDVEILNQPSDGQGLVFSEVKQAFVNQALPPSGASVLDDLTDVEITNPMHNDIVQFDERLRAFTNKPLSVSSGNNVTVTTANLDGVGVGYPAIFLNNALRLADAMRGDTYATYAAISATSKTEITGVIFGVIDITVDPRDDIRAGNYISVYQGYWKALGEVVSMLGAGEYNYAGIALTDNVDGVVTMLVQNGFYTTPPKS